MKAQTKLIPHLGDLPQREKARILVLSSYYLPSFLAGGPIKSISGIVDALGTEFEFLIVTRNHDLKRREPVSETPAGSWVACGAASVYRIKSTLIGYCRYIVILLKGDYELLYLNSVFDRPLSILPIVVRYLTGRRRLSRVLIAPRGELAKGALQFRRTWKDLYIAIAKTLGLYRDVYWHASTKLEATEITTETGCQEVSVCNHLQNIFHARDLAPESKHEYALWPSGTRKSSGHLSVVFLSRISPKKNLDGALAILSGLVTKGDIHMDIYGPIEGPASYWAKCTTLMGCMPPNVHVQYCGPIPQERVFEIFASHDLFLFPTYNENFGHVLWEALEAGCPILTSDQVPLRDLETFGAGWNIPLHCIDRYREILQECVELSADDYVVLRHQSHVLSETLRSARWKDIEDNRVMFKGLTS